jgi:hypothetical protein
MFEVSNTKEKKENKIKSPSFERNKEPILDILKKTIEKESHFNFFEVASGTVLLKFKR